jgi:hypothetical protein
LGFWASTSSLSRIFATIIAIGAFLLVFILLVAIFRLAAARRTRRKVEQQAEPGVAKQPVNQPTAQQPNAAIHEYIQNAYFTQAPEEAPLDERRRRIEKWRAEIQNGNFDRTPHGHSHFCATETYIEMKPHLPRHVQDRLQSHHGAVTAWLGSPHLRGTEGDRRVLLGEVARIEKEWGVI